MEIAIIISVILISSVVAYYAVKAKYTDSPRDMILMDEPKDYSPEISIPVEQENESHEEPESFTFTPPIESKIEYVENTTEKWVDPSQLKPISPVVEKSTKVTKAKKAKAKKEVPSKKMKPESKKDKKDKKEIKGKKEVKKPKSKKGKNPGRDRLLLS